MNHSAVVPLILPMETLHEVPLRESVRNAVEQYLVQLEGHPAQDLYRMVLSEVERPLLEAVLAHTGSNQSKAARLLGISRSTLRKKLIQYHLG